MRSGSEATWETVAETRNPLPQYPVLQGYSGMSVKWYRNAAVHDDVVLRWCITWIWILWHIFISFLIRSTRLTDSRSKNKHEGKLHANSCCRQLEPLLSLPFFYIHIVIQGCWSQLTLTMLHPVYQESCEKNGLNQFLVVYVCLLPFFSDHREKQHQLLFPCNQRLWARFRMAAEMCCSHHTTEAGIWMISARKGIAKKRKRMANGKRESDRRQLQCHRVLVNARSRMKEKMQVKKRRERREEYCLPFTSE